MIKLSTNLHQNIPTRTLKRYKTIVEQVPKLKTHNDSIFFGIYLCVMKVKTGNNFAQEIIKLLET